MFILTGYSKLKFSCDVEMRADPSFAKNGEPIHEGKTKRRRILGNDIRLAIYVKNSGDFLDKLTKPIDYFRFVKIKDENICLNIRSLAKRLHLNREQIKTMAKEGEIQDFIDSDHQDLIHSLNLFESLTKSNQVAGNLVSTTGFSNKQLMHLSKLAVQQSKMIQEGQSRIISIFNHQFILEKNGEKIQLTHVYGYKYLIKFDYRAKLKMTLDYLNELKKNLSSQEQNDKIKHKIYFIAGSEKAVLIKCDREVNLNKDYVKKFLKKFLITHDFNIIDRSISRNISKFQLSSESINDLELSIRSSLGE